MFGYACNETPELMPLPLSLAHSLTRRLAAMRNDGTLPYLRPDGKAQVSVEYHDGKPSRVDTIVVSTQHDDQTTIEQIRADMLEHVIRPVVPADMLDIHTRYFVNPTGRFVIGGPMGDSGLTGRKIIVDTYGGMARHGGGAFSGKDPTKVDRSASYAARWVAKNVVAAGLVERFELRVAYAIGVAHPVSIGIECFGTARIEERRIEELIRDHFDLRPAAIIRDLDLRRPIYRQTATYGHFGRPDLDLPWERLDRVDALRAAAGLAPAPIGSR
jgi:S-adenosylmethionine synthetase